MSKAVTDSPINTWNFCGQHVQWAAKGRFFRIIAGFWTPLIQGMTPLGAGIPGVLNRRFSESMPVAFKEWAVTVRALAEGEQLLTLRKGGIREDHKHFEIDHERFFLYPTFDHQRNNLVRQSHHPELRRALEEGVWADGEPPPKALIQDGGIEQPDRVRIRAWAEVHESYEVSDPRIVDALSPFHIWTPDYAFKRLRWKPRHPLHVLVLRVYRIQRPVTVRVRPEYEGCKSWVEIDRDLPFEGTPVIADEEFDRAAAGIESAVREAGVLAGAASLA
jgi:hypothetical protein